ncbi:hypothetical protein BO78DRAFT_446785 [Aspergillus sclerotiicarbonarius CBS 121057]|uniref:Uncharacterized protein n=1 Tax=Aspergillus sclerotiicarbonarius (strain CBS 121057 / IBT 28362) TaxID=1448318 RepID=A0A319E711_ASPSB|nr:hypothetical protein BO78DRAFT_446785 [Aspergillus sclerotiicarbonarius CBS 121057]
MDPVSLILGITPLVIEAIKTYRVLHAKFKAYRQYSKILRRLHTQLETQSCLFLNECRLLLRLVVGDEVRIKAMLADERHEGWDAESLDHQWRQHLDQNYDTCTNIIVSDGQHPAHRYLKGFLSPPQLQPVIPTQEQGNKAFKGKSPGPDNTSPMHRPIKARKLRFSDDHSSASDRPGPNSHPDSVNLLLSQDVCSDLSRGASACHSNRQPTCVGYLETATKDYRHVFFSSIISPYSDLQGDLSKVSDLLERTLNSTIGIVDQPKLARAMASSYDMMEVESTDRHEMSFNLNVQLLHGIRSLPLYSLGVALLQIGRWRRLDAQDVVSVRKLADGSSRPGARYKRLTQKCLGCDFGLGVNLTEPLLQHAVQDTIIGELTDMIASLDISVE